MTLLNDFLRRRADLRSYLSGLVRDIGQFELGKTDDYFHYRARQSACEIELILLGLRSI